MSIQTMKPILFKTTANKKTTFVVNLTCFNLKKKQEIAPVSYNCGGGGA